MQANFLSKSKFSRQLNTKRFYAHNHSTSNSTFDFSKSKINHVAVAVPDLDQSIDFYKNVLGATVSQKEALPEHGVTVAFVDFAGGNESATKIELLNPLGENSPIANFLSKNKFGGMHHICVDVEDLSQTLVTLKEKGIVPLAPPKIGSHGKNVVFLHPKNCNGVLIELQDMKE